MCTSPYLLLVCGCALLACCLLYVGCYVVSFDGCRLLIFVCCATFVGCWLLCCSLFVVCCVWHALERCLPAVVCCVQCNVFCLMDVACLKRLFVV